MPEASRYWFTHKEVVTALIKQQGVREGIWSLSVEFALVAINAGPDDERLAPTAMVPVKRIGIVKVDELGPLAVDAAIANPRPKASKKKPSARET